MKRHTCLLTFALATLLAVPASAQYKDRRLPKLRTPRITIDDWSPKSGSPGTLVTIRGKGFTNKTRLLFGGRPVRPSQVRPTWISFKVPSTYDDGTIVLRHPGVARDIRVGNFAIVETARITRFAPLSGVAGTRVELSGTGFRKGDQVMMNGRTLRINRSAPRRIVVTIPKGATTDYLTVVSANGTRVRTAERFNVLLPAPVITNLTPWSGMPGGKVRINGQYLTDRDQVFYGKKRLKIVGHGQGWIDVLIPPRARQNRYLNITGPNGTARSPRKFQIEQPPLVSRIAPTWGRVGTKVRVYGRNFRAGDRVTMGGVPLEILQLRARQIAVRIPNGARSGPISVARGDLQVSSPQSFDLVYQPVIRSYAPVGGKPGTRVTIRGEYFAKNAAVFYGAKRLRVLKRQGDHTLVVKIPPRATEQAFRVRTRAGEAVSAQAFRVHILPAIRGVKPARGYPGTKVTLTGQNMRYADAVYLGKTQLPIASRGPRRIVVEIPMGVGNGPIVVSSFGQMLRTRYRFKVLGGPEITGFTPRGGPPGTRITIDGRNFSREAAVRFGDVPLKVIQWQKNRLVVKLPRTARPEQRFLRVRNGLAETRSPEQFNVWQPAVFTGFSPEWVEAGATVQLRGQHFHADTKVYWGKVSLKIVKLGKAGRRITARLPNNVVGVRYLWVDDGGARHQSATKLEVRSRQRYPNRKPRKDNRRLPKPRKTKGY